MVDPSKILRFYRVPGTRFKTLDDVLRYQGYRIEAQVATGEFSALHRAVYTKTGIAVACKVIDLNNGMSNEWFSSKASGTLL